MCVFVYIILVVLFIPIEGSLGFSIYILVVVFMFDLGKCRIDFHQGGFEGSERGSWQIQGMRSVC